MELFGIAVTALAAILTYQAWKNGRWMKQTHKETQDLIREMHRDSTESFKKMDDTLKEISRLIVAEGERGTRALGGGNP
jgi:hypothetical protein